MLQRALQCVMTAKLPRTLAVPPPPSISCRGHAGILPRQPTINSSDGADARTSGLTEAAADPRSIELLVNIHRTAGPTLIQGSIDQNHRAELLVLSGPWHRGRRWRLRECDRRGVRRRNPRRKLGHRHGSSLDCADRKNKSNRHAPDRRKSR